jgi:nitrite reductase (NO-forming)
MRHRLIIIGIALFTALAAAGCGRQAQQPAGQSGSAANTINVSEREWSITLTPATVPPGTYTFSVKNDGTIEHNFVLQGLSIRLDGIQVGQTKTVTARLTPGTYTILCDIPGHAEAGMKTTLTVK